MKFTKLLPLDDLDGLVLVKDIDYADAANVFGDESTDDDYDDYFRKMADAELLDLPTGLLHSIAAEDVLTRIEILNPNLLSDSQKELLDRWRSFPCKDTKMTVPRLLDMFSRMTEAQFMVKRECRNETDNKLRYPLGFEGIIKSLDVSHFQGSKAETLKENDTFTFDIPVQDGTSVKHLEVRIKIGKDPIGKCIFALVSLSRVTSDDAEL